MRPWGGTAFPREPCSNPGFRSKLFIVVVDVWQILKNQTATANPGWSVERETPGWEL